MNNSEKLTVRFCHLLQLKKEQELQKQMLWHTFQEKNKQLELQHKWQLEHKFQVRKKINLYVEKSRRNQNESIKKHSNIESNAQTNVNLPCKNITKRDQISYFISVLQFHCCNTSKSNGHY